MARKSGFLIGGLAAVLLVAAAARTQGQNQEQQISVKTLPPVVVRTLPRAGDTKVNATRVKEIRVTFSKAMTDKSWSWATVSADTFPPIVGDIHYTKDKRTCVAPVKLEPGRVYAIWLNSEKFVGFKDADGRAAVPYLLVFETKAARK